MLVHPPTMPALRPLVLVAFAVLPGFVSPLAAQTTWDGGGLGNTTWADPANWDNDTLPAFDGTDSLTVTAPTAGNTSLTLGGNRNIGRITFGAGGTVMTLSGDTIILNRTNTAAGGNSTFTGNALWNANTADGQTARVHSNILLQNGTAGNYTGFFRENINSNGGTRFNGTITQGAGELWTLRFSQASTRGNFFLNNASNTISGIRNDGTTITSQIAGAFGGATLTMNGGSTGTSTAEHFAGSSAVSNDVVVVAASSWSSGVATRLTGNLNQGTSVLTYGGAGLTYLDYASVNATTGTTNLTGTVAASSMTKLSNATLSIGTSGAGVFVLSGNASNNVPTWADFSANRTYNQSGGSGTWRITSGTTGGQHGGFAARGADVIIPASGGGLTNATFARNLALGSTVTENGVRYADNAVIINTDIAYAPSTNYEIRVADNTQVVRSDTNWSFGGPVHELAGQITGDNIAIIGISGTAGSGMLRISNATNSLTNTGGNVSAWVIGSTRNTQITPGGRSVGGGNHKDNSNIVMVFTSDGAFGGAADVVVSSLSSSGSSAGGYLLLEDTNGAGSTTFGQNFSLNASTTVGAGFGAWGGDVIYQGNGTSTGVITLNGSGVNLPLSAENGSTFTLGTNGGSAATIANFRSAATTYNTAGNGTVVLQNVVYSGTQSAYSWNIREGTLLANNAAGSATGAGNITASAGGTLGGNGSVSGFVTMQAGSILAPGSTVAPGNGPGTLEIGGNLSLASTTDFKLELGGANPGDGAGFYDQVNVLGNANLNGTLTLNTFGGYDPAGGTFYILSRAGGTGNFTGLAEGAQVSINGGLWTGNITYNATWTGLQGTSSLIGGNDVALYNIIGIPEPNVALMILGGFGLMAMFRRRS
jgi:fibronectin-binding autotransporter adhesin